MAAAAAQGAKAKSAHVSPSKGDAAAATPGKAAKRAASPSGRMTAKQAYAAGRADGGPLLLEAHRANVAAKKTAMRDAATQRTSAILANARADKAAAENAIEGEARRVEQALDTTRGHVDAVTDAARNEIESARQTRTDASIANTEAQLERLDGMVQAKQEFLGGTSESRATAILEEGRAQARRATETCAEKSKAAWILASRKRAQYGSGERADEIANVIQDMAREAADGITAAGSEMADASRADAAALAAKFRQESADAKSDFPSVLRDTSTEIADARQRAITDITETAARAQSQLDDAHQAAVAELESHRGNLATPVREAAALAGTGIDQQATQACEQLETEADNATAKLDEFEATVVPRLAILRGRALERSIAEADREIEAGHGGFSQALDRFVATSREGALDGANKLVGDAQRMAAAGVSIAALGTRYETAAASLSGKAAEAMGQIESEATSGAQRAIDKLDGELQRKIDDADVRWSEQLESGKRQIAAKIDDGLAVQGQTLESLATSIDEKAREIRDESWLSRAATFVGGVFAGVLEGAWELLKGVLLVALVVLAIAIVVVLVFVVLVFVAPELALALLVGAAAVAGAVAGFVAAYGAVILGVLAVAAIGLVIYNLYTAFTTKGIGDFDLGRAVGKAIFDVVSIAFAEKMFGWAGRLIARLGRWLGFVGEDGARLARLLELLGGDEAKLEGLVGAFGGNAARLERVLGLVNKDAAKLERLLALVAGEGATLERLLGLTDNDAAVLERILKASDDAAQAERLLLAAKGDAVLLDQLLTKAGAARGANDGAKRVETLIQRAEEKSLALVESALDKAADKSEDLDRLTETTGWLGKGDLTLTPQEAGAVDDFLRTAAENEPSITKELEAIRGKINGAEFEGFANRLKGEDSLKRKVATALREDPKRSLERALNNIKDAVRYTLRMPADDYALGAQRALDELQARGFKAIGKDVKNTWPAEGQRPTGYPGINSHWRDPASNQAFELQFHTAESFEAKTVSHKLYEERRLPNVSEADKNRLEREEARIFGEVPVPSGAASVRLSK
ncbi:hypothetical protein LZC95_21195 [Pendulispora brunnea]|uniref:Uncharacterized protein n=1 Tax=Pendulispora brunnea TaxID=2905690 RepID=A0ABZ2KQQ6_9BACT